MNSIIQHKYKKLFAKADIEINGDKPWDMQVRNPKLWSALLFKGSLGLGEAYMQGWYEVEDLSEFFYRIARFILPDYSQPTLRKTTLALLTRIFNTQSIKKSFKVGKHYDIGNTLYEKMLGESMAYTCAYWKNASTLDEAQINKFRLIADKLQLKPGMRVLDVGCGFGSAMAFFAKQYKVEVHGITISKEQAKYIEQKYNNLSISVKVQDYRLTQGKFDRIYSVGMFEHVGYKNYQTYMQNIRRLLKNDGLMLLHTIGSDVSVKTTNAWIEKYIFPNSMLPSLSQISMSAETEFIIEDVQNFGHDYYKTLIQWHKNFTHHWPALAKKYEPTFYRMWQYYLLSCAGFFKAREMQLFQIVFSTKTFEKRYDSTR